MQDARAVERAAKKAAKAAAKIALVRCADGRAAGGGGHRGPVERRQHDAWPATLDPIPPVLAQAEHKAEAAAQKARDWLGGGRAARWEAGLRAASLPTA